MKITICFPHRWYTDPADIGEPFLKVSGRVKDGWENGLERDAYIEGFYYDVRWIKCKSCGKSKRQWRLTEQQAEGAND